MYANAAPPPVPFASPLGEADYGQRWVEVDLKAEGGNRRRAPVPSDTTGSSSALRHCRGDNNRSPRQRHRRWLFPSSPWLPLLLMLLLLMCGCYTQEHAPFAVARGALADEQERDSNQWGGRARALNSGSSQQITRPSLIRAPPPETPAAADAEGVAPLYPSQPFTKARFLDAAFFFFFVAAASLYVPLCTLAQQTVHPVGRSGVSGLCCDEVEVCGGHWPFRPVLVVVMA
ncbi:hypothetical protein HPB51_009460 [Rhipicephalus microplus]|uniref:Transmembrane protein n=1 Tax=Rhipicephalus microplus TaxID=6941 RepID=A0A9J6DUY9_RHIMP|nr:hypothetical protein HPB51_009460 [Rhipicephalus microplus]